MSYGDLPLFSMLRGRLHYLSERQKVVAQNVANADTPGFQPKDLKPFTFQAKVESAVAGYQAATRPGHMRPAGMEREESAKWKAVPTPDSETTLDGNGVVLEEQMLKMSDARMNYDMAVTFYQKSLGLLRAAARKPGSM